MVENQLVVEFKISFRKIECCGDICDYCESKPICWYNELQCIGYCPDCMKDLIAEYEKKGGI